MGTEHGPGIGKLPFENEHDECERVGEPTHEEQLSSFATGCVLMNEQQIVPEIEISFAGVDIP